MMKYGKLNKIMNYVPPSDPQSKITVMSLFTLLELALSKENDEDKLPILNDIKIILAEDGSN